MKISKVKKRDGRVVEFDQSKITRAIQKALQSVGREPGGASSLSDEVVTILEGDFEDKNPGVEDIQDRVEQILIKNNFSDAAKAYILYRQKRAEMRDIKRLIGVEDDLKLSVNAIEVLKRRYLAKNDKGEIIETPSQLFRRVATAVAAVDEKYEGGDVWKTEEEFYQSMINLEFLPNSPTLMNAGLQLGQLSACFVIPVGDSIIEIFDALKYMALIHQSGGGTGFSFSQLRPIGDIVHSTKGVASGPISFMRIFNIATEVVKQGGRRRGANMGVLNVNHPDVADFITAKNKEGFLSNFNLSVGVTDDFMRAIKDDEKFLLINPRNGEKEGKLSAKHVFDLITTSAWGTGDPGMVFLDEINRHNPTPQIGEIKGTNPCGEVPLLDYESCNLGSINLSRMVDERKKVVDWDKLRKTVKTSVHFLDNIIDANKYPLPEVKKMTLANRKIGLGVMGFAELLIKLGIPYESEQAIDVAEKVMQFISEEARKKSSELGQERGGFPNFKGSIWVKKGFTTMRNATVTTIAPTGSISVIAGCSSGIEPLFAISFIRNVLGGTELLEVNSLFEEVAKRRGFYSKELMNRIARNGSIQNIDIIPEDVKKLFLTAFDITPAWHVKIQAVFQKYTDNAVSKTVNLPPDASPAVVKEIYWLAYKLKCKGITVYRYGSKKDQVLNIGHVKGKRRPGASVEYVNVDSEFSGGCPTTGVCTF